MAALMYCLFLRVDMQKPLCLCTLLDMPDPIELDLTWISNQPDLNRGEASIKGAYNALVQLGYKQFHMQRYSSDDVLGSSTQMTMPGCCEAAAVEEESHRFRHCHPCCGRSAGNGGPNENKMSDHHCAPLHDV